MALSIKLILAIKSVAKPDNFFFASFRFVHIFSTSLFLYMISRLSYHRHIEITLSVILLYHNIFDFVKGRIINYQNPLSQKLRLFSWDPVESILIAFLYIA